MDKTMVLGAITGVFSAATMAVADITPSVFQDSPKILVTGFEAFGDNIGPNTTQVLFDSMHDELQAIGVDVQILPVSYQDVDDFLSQIDVTNYDYVISFGMDTRETAPSVTLEPHTYNAFYDVDDNGHCPFETRAQNGETCFNNGQEVSLTNLYPDPAMLEIAKSPGFELINANFEGAPQSYICAYLYHGLLTQAEGTGTKEIFVHLGGDDYPTHNAFLRNYLQGIVRDHAGLPVPQYAETVVYETGTN